MSNENNTMDYFLDHDINVVQSFGQFDWTDLAILFVFFLISFFGLIGNVVTIISTLYLELRPLLATPATPTNIFLGGLATADLVLINFCIFTKVAKLFSYTWMMGMFLCKSVRYIQSVSIICSVVMLTAMSIERYFAIIYPMKAQYKCTISQARKVVITIWITSFLLGIPMIFVQAHDVMEMSVIAYWCVRESDAGLLWCGHEVYMLILILVLPLTFMLFCYTAICWKIQLLKKGRYHMTARHVLSSNDADTESIPMSQMQNIRNDRHYREDGRMEEESRTVKQVVKMLVAMVVVFAICWGPILIENTLTAYGVLPPVKRGMHKHLNTAFQLMAFFNSCINPIIYAFMSNQFRKSFLSATCGGWWICCLKRGHKAPMRRHSSLSERCGDVEMWPARLPEDGMPTPRIAPLQLLRDDRHKYYRLPLPCGLIYLEFIVHGRSYDALVDTGATRSYLQSDLAELCRRVGDPWKLIHQTLRVANRGEVVTDGEIEVLATINGQPIWHRYGVLPILNQTILLGMDILGRMETCIQIGQYQWDWSDEPEALELTGPTGPGERRRSSTLYNSSYKKSFHSSGGSTEGRRGIDHFDTEHLSTATGRSSRPQPRARVLHISRRHHRTGTHRRGTSRPFPRDLPTTLRGQSPDQPRQGPDHRRHTTTYEHQGAPLLPDLAAPLNRPLQKLTGWKWAAEEDAAAFHELRHRLATAPVLTCPDFTREFTLQTDTNNEGLGAVLTQDHEGEEYVVAYTSRALNQAERNYSTTENECLAIVWGIRKSGPV